MAAAKADAKVAGEIPAAENSNPTPLPSPTPASNNPFISWFYFTAAVTLLTVIFTPISPFFADQDHSSWFLSLPDDLRRHYSSGRAVKVEVGTDRSPAEIFAVEHGPKDGSETVLFVHGFGSSSFSFRRLLPAVAGTGLRAVAIDLPGFGFSDKYVEVEEDVENHGGVLGVYYEIKEKGLFWGFDQLIETGQVPYNGAGEEGKDRIFRRKVRRAIVGGEADVIRQVVDSLRLAPVHLVLHDTGVVPGTAWAVVEGVRSVTVLDGAAAPALPLWALELPVVREVVLGMPVLYFGLLRWCCSRKIDRTAAEAHRLLLKGKGGRGAAVAVGRSLNASFELGEWGRSEKARNLPVQVLWSQNWSKEWTEEGRRVASELHQANSVEHSGGRWPQEDAVEELTVLIADFVKSLPKSIQPNEEEPVPEHVKKVLEEASSNADNHHHHSHHHQSGFESLDHDHHHHAHAHGAGYMDAYGLGHGWGAH